MSNSLIPTPIVDGIQRGSNIGAVLDTTMRYVVSKDIVNPQQIDKDWVETTSSLIDFFHEMHIADIHFICVLLAIYDQNWKNIPKDLRDKLGPDLITFSAKFTEGEYSTVRNYVRVGREWFLNSDKLPSHVEILRRDQTGKPVRNPDGSWSTQRIEFKPWEIPYSKLLVATTQMKRGTLKPEVWSMLADPHFNRDDIVSEMNTSQPDSPSQTQYRMEGPLIIATRNGMERQIAELNWLEYEDDDLVRECIDRLLSFWCIELDEDAILRLTRRANGKVVVEGEVVDTKGSKW